MTKQTATDELSTFLKIWQDGPLTFQPAQAITCREFDALADLFRVNGREDILEQWIESHAEGDYEGDRHFVAETVDYVVSVDPADLTQCDSCQ